MTLRLSHRPHHHGLLDVAYQAHVYDILTAAADIVGSRWCLYGRSIRLPVGAAQDRRRIERANARAAARIYTALTSMEPAK